MTRRRWVCNICFSYREWLQHATYCSSLAFKSSDMEGSLVDAASVRDCRGQFDTRCPDLLHQRHRPNVRRAFLACSVSRPSWSFSFDIVSRSIAGPSCETVRSGTLDKLGSWVDILGGRFCRATWEMNEVVFGRLVARIDCISASIARRYPTKAWYVEISATNWDGWDNRVRSYYPSLHALTLSLSESWASVR